MNTRDHLDMKLRSIWLGTLAILIGVVIADSTFAQYQSATEPKQRTVRQFKGVRPEPVELRAVKEQNKRLVMGEPFEANEDWLKGMAFDLKNVFSKDITYIEVYLNFPETTSSGNEMAYVLKFGENPKTNDIQKEVPILKPGEEITLTLDENTYQRLSQFLQKRHPISSLTTVRVDFGLVVFSDHTAWQAGNYYKQDPVNPRHFINVGEPPPDD